MFKEEHPGYFYVNHVFTEGFKGISVSLPFLSEKNKMFLPQLSDKVSKQSPLKKAGRFIAWSDCQKVDAVSMLLAVLITG